MMRERLARLLGGVVILGVAGCAVPPPDGPANTDGTERLFVGQRDDAPGSGIVAGRFDPRTGLITLDGLAAAVPRPTWLLPTAAGDTLFSVSETGNDGRSHGQVWSLAVNGPVLRATSRVDSAGGGPTALAFDRRSSTLFVANFGGGQVGAIPVAPDGTLQPVASVVQDTGSGPTPRQKGPHAHGVTLDPSGRFLLVPDLGADRIFVYGFDGPTRHLSASSSVVLPPGSGPRRLVFTPDGRFAFLLTELSGTVIGYRWDASAGRLSEIERLPLDPPGFAGKRSGAEIAVSRDGRFVYLSNRGEDALQLYAVDPDSGRLALRQRIPSGGKVPWSFTLTPDGGWLIVANQASNALTVFRIDPTTGQLAATAGPAAAVANPVSVAIIQ